ncbi:hypothetical protein TcasGA2_TC004999 [Tribolium castaneum]|uniref:Transposable element P transposase-like RNase H domain-containing protein n=1 Tax=Tribolium castaneum TaxID=7070 RepID=D6WBY5_TRICA|nr:hypothetical protein TcasGA2_TC004999 [Tribolium castaneum]
MASLYDIWWKVYLFDLFDSNRYMVEENEEKLHEWSISTGVALCNKDFVCQRHFEKYFVTEIYEGDKICLRTLASNAVPTLQLPSTSTIPIEDQVLIPSRVYEIPTQKRSPQIPSISQKHANETISKFQKILQPSHSRTSFSVKHVLTTLKENIQELHVRLLSGWGVHNNTNIVTISRVVGDIPKIDRAVVVDNCNAKVYLNGIFRFVQAVQTFEDVLNIVNRELATKGTTFAMVKKKTKRCKTCAALRNNLLRDISRKTKSTLQTNMRKKNKKKLYLRINRKEKRQAKIIIEISQILKNQDKIENIINKLPENQEMVVRTCFETVGRPVSGKRYSKEWIYTCILLKIKSLKLYRHTRTRELLPLPAPSTLSNYIRNIDSAYGFQNKLFELLKEKNKNMSEFERHGTIKVDECKITPSKHFDKNPLEVIGFVDWGNYTPNNRQNQLGDHVLVFKFQSFVGKNI